MTYRLIGPGETLKLGHDWSSWLGVATIAGSVWAADLDEAVVEDPDFEDSQTVVTLSGLTVGQVVALTNSITSSIGETGERTITVRCIQR